MWQGTTEEAGRLVCEHLQVLRRGGAGRVADALIHLIGGGYAPLERQGTAVTGMVDSFVADAVEATREAEKAGCGSEFVGLVESALQLPPGFISRGAEPLHFAGDSPPACGAAGGVRLTNHRPSVTCRACVEALERKYAAPYLTHLAVRRGEKFVVRLPACLGPGDPITGAPLADDLGDVTCPDCRRLMAEAGTQVVHFSVFGAPGRAACGEAGEPPLTARAEDVTCPLCRLVVENEEPGPPSRGEPYLASSHKLTRYDAETLKPRPGDPYLSALGQLDAEGLPDVPAKEEKPEPYVPTCGCGKPATRCIVATFTATHRERPVKQLHTGFCDEHAPPEAEPVDVVGSLPPPVNPSGFEFPPVVWEEQGGLTVNVGQLPEVPEEPPPGCVPCDGVVADAYRARPCVLREGHEGPHRGEVG
jgi:hypothetical protein